MKQRIPQLDAVRGIAILIVMVHNYYIHLTMLPLASVASYGWMGVDLFFVLSGFLITGILFDTRQSEGYFKNFYIRRCLRIWPLYYAIVFVMFVVVPHAQPAVRPILMAHSSPWWSYLFFLQNFFVYPSTGATGSLGVTWSVAIEEQFYLVWAVIVRYCSQDHLRWIALAVIGLSPFLRYFLSLQHVDLYTNVFCRLDGLMAGGFLALSIRCKKFAPERFLSAAALVLFLAIPLAIITETYGQRWLTYSLSSMASAAFLYLALFAKSRWFQSIMTSRALIYTGTISYGLYLLHRLPLDAERSSRFAAHPGLTLLAGFAASFVLATLSWRLLETPFLRLKRYFESQPAPMAEGSWAIAAQ
jgi:peptidoglycan/LPS O-acetylase OafA/YrhL